MKTIDDQLAEDQRLYGSSFERIDRDGKRTRLDPRTVKVQRDIDVAVAITVSACSRKAAQMLITYCVSAAIIGAGVCALVIVGA